MDKRLRSIRQYRRALDRVLLTCDFEKLRAFMKANGMPKPSSDEVLEITMHKVITGAKSLPTEFRRVSKAWLIERGFQAWDDGDI